MRSLIWCCNRSGHFPPPPPLPHLLLLFLSSTHLILFLSSTHHILPSLQHFLEGLAKGLREEGLLDGVRVGLAGLRFHFLLSSLSSLLLSFLSFLFSALFFFFSFLLFFTFFFFFSFFSFLVIYFPTNKWL